MAETGDHDADSKIRGLQSALQGGVTAPVSERAASISAAELEKRRRTEIDKKLREGYYPQISRRAVKPGPLVEVPSIFLRIPIFRYSHKVSTYTIEEPFRVETGWGIAHYVGPALEQFDLTVLATALKVAGSGILKGPRRSFSHLRLVGSKRRVTLDDPDVLDQADPYEMLEAIFGASTLAEIARTVFGSMGGAQVNRTRASLLRLWDGRFYTQPHQRKGRPELPDWLRYEHTDTLIQDHGETPLDDSRPNPLTPSQRQVLGMQSGEENKTPMRRYPFYDLYAENSLEPRGNLHFVFSPFLGELLKDRVTFLDLRLRQQISNDGLALQLSAFISSMTNKNNAEMNLGYDKLIDVIGYENVQRKKIQRKGGDAGDGNEVATVEYLDRSGFKREIERRCQKLEDVGFLKAWSSKPLFDKARKTDKLQVVRSFTNVDDRSELDEPPPEL